MWWQSHEAVLAHEADFEGFRRAARHHLAHVRVACRPTICASPSIRAGCSEGRGRGLAPAASARRCSRLARGLPARRARTLRADVPPAVAPAGPARAAARPARCGPPAARPHGAGGAARAAQDEGLRALPTGRRAGAGRPAARRLVRARAPCAGGGRALLRAALRGHALLDPDAAPQPALVRPGAALGRWLHARIGPPPDAGEGALARLLRPHLQSRAAQARGDGKRDAAALLVQPARGGADRAAGRCGHHPQRAHAAGTGRPRRCGASPRRRARRIAPGAAARAKPLCQAWSCRFPRLRPNARRCCGSGRRCRRTAAPARWARGRRRPSAVAARWTHG